MQIRQRHLVAGILLLLFATYFGYSALSLHYFTPMGPGPGFFPFWLCFLLGIAAILLIVDALRRAPEPTLERFLPGRVGLLRIGAIIIAVAAVVVLLEPLGFRLSMLLMYLFVLYTLGRRDIIISPLIAVAGSFGAYHVFVHWLGVPLPVGVTGW